MKDRLLHEDDGLRKIVAILDRGDEVMACLQSLAERHRLTGAQLTAIGAFESAELAFFDWESKTYEPIPVEEQTEVASLIGDIAADADGRPSLHMHVVLGRRDGSTVAGHLQRAVVRPTLEVVVTETTTRLCRLKDEASGLALIRPEAGR